MSLILTNFSKAGLLVEVVTLVVSTLKSAQCFLATVVEEGILIRCWRIVLRFLKRSTIEPELNQTIVEPD